MIGVPDDDLGEIPKAVVQPIDMPADDEAGAALERELIDYCRASLARSSAPARWTSLRVAPRRDGQALQAPAARRVLAGTGPPHLADRPQWSDASESSDQGGGATRR